MTWQPVMDDTVLSYRVICTADAVSPVEISVNGSVSEAVVGPLNTIGFKGFGEEYTCVVFAVNAFGESDGTESNAFATG